jgi:lipopolysaccharide transport system ATP-binding protein
MDSAALSAAPVTTPPIAGETPAGARVTVERASVDFPLYHGNSRSLKKTMVFAASSGRMAADNRQRVVVQALRDISFALAPGDRLGLIGANGAGKTTLLHMLAGIYEPTSGRVVVRGSLNALLSPTLGMNPDMTGRENISLRGMYNRMSSDRIAQLEADVEAFADLGEFIDVPIRFYSSGMTVRLGFALATAIRPQILLMDEWFLAGDASFMGKASERLEQVVRGAEVLVLSSHSTDTLRQWCNRLIWLDKGRIRADGPPEEITAQYLASV